MTTVAIYCEGDCVYAALALASSEAEHALPQVDVLTARVAELEACLVNVLSSAHPNERDHPFMSAAWTRGRLLLGMRAIKDRP